MIPKFGPAYIHTGPALDGWRDSPSVLFLSERFSNHPVSGFFTTSNSPSFVTSGESRGWVYPENYMLFPQVIVMFIFASIRLAYTVINNATAVVNQAIISNVLSDHYLRDLGWCGLINVRNWRQNPGKPPNQTTNNVPKPGRNRAGAASTEPGRYQPYAAGIETMPFRAWQIMACQ